MSSGVSRNLVSAIISDEDRNDSMNRRLAGTLLLVVALVTLAAGQAAPDASASQPDAALSSSAMSPAPLVLGSPGVTYRLHYENSAIDTSARILKTATSDHTVASINAASPMGAVGDYMIAKFESQASDPGIDGTLP